MKKYLKVMLVLVVALSMLCTFALADNPFAVSGTSQAAGITKSISNIGATVIDIVQTVGYIVAVVMVLVVGIQWLMGTPAKKQELKGRMWNIVIGAVLIVAGVTLLGVVADFAEDAEAGLETSALTISERA